MIKEYYLIWSFEHFAWWKPGHAGYTSLIERAGRYDREEALKICNGANWAWDEDTNPLELPVPESMAVELQNKLGQKP